MKKFTKKLAQEVAQHQFNWTYGRIVGTDILDIPLESEAENYDFESPLERMGIDPTPQRVEEIKSRYTKLANEAKEKLKSMFKPVSYERY